MKPEVSKIGKKLISGPILLMQGSVCNMDPCIDQCEKVFSMSNREQIVIANGVKSKESLVKSGVPQGTVSGPILFLILINDIDNNISSTASMFADDTRILRKISTQIDVEALQEDLQKVFTWQDENNMKFNSKKFELLRYGPNQEIKENTGYLTPEGETIEQKDNLRDLGIQMSDNSTFSEHIAKVCKKVNQKCGWILRTFSCRNTYFMKLMWKSLVQPNIDYCSQLWMPMKAGEIEKIENLQKQFTKKIPEVRHLSYWERLKQLKMLSQQRRMERYRIIYTWKILEGKSPNCGLTSKSHERLGRICDIPQIKTNSKAAIQTLRENSFQVNGPKLFNCLPKKIRNKKGC